MGCPEDVSTIRHEAHVVVQPVSRDATGRPFRRVDILGQDVGRAYEPADVAEFMRRAGLDTALVEDTGIIEWRGGGPETWD